MSSANQNLCFHSVFLFVFEYLNQVVSGSDFIFSFFFFIVEMKGKQKWVRKNGTSSVLETENIPLV